jgi:hypothetical protein
MSTSTVRRLVFSACVLAAASACGGASDGGTEPNPGAAGLKVVAGAGAADTVLTTLATPLQVEVRDATGDLRSGVSVRFQALPSGDPSRSGDAAMYVCGGTRGRCGETAPEEYPRDFAVTTTSGRGVAAVGVKLGVVAGPAAIEVRVPTLGFVDTAHFTVRPGTGTGVRVAVVDTALFVGSSYSLAAAAVDRHGNVTAGTPTFEALDGAVTTSNTGVVTAGAIGRARVVARFGAASATSSVSVVPQGAFAAFRLGTSASEPTGVVTANLDGSGFRFISPIAVGNGPFPVISPRTGEILYTDGIPAPRLAISDALGANRRDFAAAAPAIATSQYARFSADGSSVSFVCYPDEGAAFSFAMCRSAADGTSVTQLVTLPVSVMTRLAPMLSPDGTRVVFATGGGAIEFVSVPGGAVSFVSVNGEFPRWSPTGDRIAFTNLAGGAVKVMNADGSNVRTLTTTGTYDAAPEWSTDGQWLLVRGTETLDLVRVSDGLTLPLPVTGRYYQASWRP